MEVVDELKANYMLTVNEFSLQYPHYRIDFSIPLGQQPRIYDVAALTHLPVELAPSHEYRSGGRGRPNLNQTLTHGQCKSCKKVLRNDFFYAPPSIMRRNGVFTHCLTCTQAVNADRYRTSSSAIRTRRILIWQYLAPRCTLCGFDQHVSAMDMHHIGNKEMEIATLITDVTFSPNSHRIEKLLREASHCIALCSNCHRMLHAGAIKADEITLQPLSYKLVELVNLLKEIGGDTSND